MGTLFLLSTSLLTLGSTVATTPGDVYFISSDDPHTLFKLGETSSRHFAFQWR